MLLLQCHCKFGAFCHYRHKDDQTQSQYLDGEDPFSSKFKKIVGEFENLKKENENLVEDIENIKKETQI